jgi:carboxylate-amine ligase
MSRAEGEGMHQGAFTVGVEEEYQLVDPEDGMLRGRAPELLEEGVGKGEFQRTMIEVTTPICQSAAEARARLVEQRRTLAGVAAEHGLAIAAAGLHPVGPYPRTQISDTPLYRRVAAYGGNVARELHVFGLHVHVGVPSREAAVRAMCGITPYIPHLLIPAASSPFYQGHDTRFQSYRTLLRDMSPRVGLPLPIVSVREFDQLEQLLAGGPVDPRRNSPIAWDVRPSHRYPTLEFRFFDSTPWLDTVELLVALARSLTAMYEDRPAPPLTGTEMQLIRENRWRAARFGMSARFFRLDPVTGETRTAHDSILALVERLAPVAERLGDGGTLALLEPVLERGSAATAMREIFRREGSFPEVVRWVVEETATLPPAPPAPEIG